VIQISEPEYKAEVTEASKSVWVVLHLFVFSRPDCQVFNKFLDVVATKFKDVKFVKIIAQEAIRNYPETSCPTLILYHNGDIVAQLVGLAAFGGPRTSAESIEWVLSNYNVVKTELEDDPLKKGIKITSHDKSGFVARSSRHTNKGQGRKDSDSDEDRLERDD